jgi:hypothetical protein
MREDAMKMLNPDFELNTFYWLYVKAEAGVVTYTAVLYDTTDGHNDDNTPYMTITTNVATNQTFWEQPEQDEYTVDGRVIEAMKKHFNHEFMLSDGRIMSAEYCCGASGQLHKHDEYGQAIFGMDLEEAYSDEI